MTGDQTSWNLACVLPPRRFHRLRSWSLSRQAMMTTNMIDGSAAMSRKKSSVGVIQPISMVANPRAHTLVGPPSVLPWIRFQVFN